MARWQLGARYEKRSRKSLTLDQRLVAKRYLDKLARDPPPGNLGFRPMEGRNGLLWECRAGGQNRFILRKTEDEHGTLFIVEDVGPHDIYGDY